MSINAITFVVAVNDEEVYRNNFLASPVFAKPFTREILARRDFPSAAKAYNTAIDEASHDLIAFVHQDIVLPPDWLDDLAEALKYLEKTDPVWGVLGCVGVTDNYEWIADVYCTSNKIIYPPFVRPMKVRTLDEVVLILRKSSGLRFDEDLPHFHFYGTDICLRAASLHMNCYSIPAFCLHNSNKTVLYPKEFFEACDHIRKRWKDCLPVDTSCVTISRSRAMFYIKHKYMREIQHFFSRLRHRNTPRNMRVEDPLGLLGRLLEKGRQGPFRAAR